MGQQHVMVTVAVAQTEHYVTTTREATEYMVVTLPPGPMARVIGRQAELLAQKALAGALLPTPAKEGGRG